MPISIRPLADTDLESAADILTSAFHRSGNWANELRLYRELQPDGYFGAYQEGALVGMVGSTIYSTFAYVGMMGVHQQFQRQGIGLALMQHFLKWLDGKNVPQIQLDASEAGQPMYEKLGFVAQERVFVLQRQAGLPALELPQHVESIRPSDLVGLTEIDAKIFGADRRKVFTALLQAYPERAFFLHDTQGRVTGYIFMQERRIGPWVMLEAGDDESLLQAVLSLDPGDMVSVVVPETNQRALEILHHYGFQIARTNRHMARGPTAAIGQRDKVYAQTSLSVG